VQREVNKVLNGPVNSLSVERKNHKDRRGQSRHGCKIASVGRCSRNSQLCTYGGERNSIVAATVTAEKKMGGAKFLNAQAFVVALYSVFSFQASLFARLLFRLAAKSILSANMCEGNLLVLNTLSSCVGRARSKTF
jgi:hypothetical protein